MMEPTPPVGVAGGTRIVTENETQVNDDGRIGPNARVVCEDKERAAI